MLFIICVFDLWAAVCWCFVVLFAWVALRLAGCLGFELLFRGFALMCVDGWVCCLLRYCCFVDYVLVGRLLIVYFHFLICGYYFDFMGLVLGWLGFAGGLLGG